MTESPLSVARTLSALRYSIFEGGFAQVYANLTGSIFLPAFALSLGASPVEIGIIAAIPFAANTAQFFGSFLVEKSQRRKSLAIWFAFAARSMWLPIVITSVIFAETAPASLLKWIIAMVFISALFGSLSGVSWLSWMAGLVPDEVRGRFFGLRNSILGGITIIVTLAGSYFLDIFPKHFPEMPRQAAFEILLGIAVVAGMLSTFFLTKKPDLPHVKKSDARLRQLYRAPLYHRHFRRLVEFAVLRSFATNIAAPFFIVYMLEDLKLSYSTIGIFTILTSLADLVGMWIWGHLSDQIGNKPVIVFAVIVTTFLPLCWLLTGPNDLTVFLLIPLFNLTGGFMWAGWNLCSVNMLFRMAPGEGNSIYFAYWSVFNGIAAGLGSLTGGLIAKNFPFLLSLLPFTLDYGYQLLFMISSMMRIIPLFWLPKIREAGGMRFIAAVGVLRNIKAWGSLMGFSAPLHFFIPTRKDQSQATPYWPIWRSSPRD